MPAYNTPKQFPGTASLPPLVQALLQRAFPPDQLPTVGAFSGTKPPFPGAGGGPIPEGIGISSLFRTGVTKIPDAPQTMDKVNSAFDLYRKVIGDLLLKGQPQK